MRRWPTISSLVLILSLTTGVAAQTTWFVDASNCPGPNDGTAIDPFCSVQAAIDAAVGGDEVIVSPGNYDELIDFGGKAITVRSTDPLDPGVVATTQLRGTGLTGSVVTFDSGEDELTVLSGLTIASGTGNTTFDPPDTYGGGVFIDGSSPTLSHCVITTCTATRGGGMYMTNASGPSVTDCTFSLNSSTATGGGASQYGGSDPAYENFAFSSNDSNFGGGAYTFESNPSFAQCTFDGNTAITRGGGLFVAFGSPTVTDCTFNANSVTSNSSNGGGLVVAVTDATVTDCTFTNNIGTRSGGGLVTQESTATITGCTFDGNTAGLYGAGVFNFIGGSPTFEGCTFLNNQTSRGGGMYSADNSPTLTSCTFEGNGAYAQGGGLYNYLGAATLTDCTFTGNEGSTGGGGIYGYGGTLTVTGGAFSGNAGSIGAGILNDNQGVATVSGVQFTGNVASGGGGGYVQGFGSTSQLSDCVFSANSAGGGGGVSAGGGSMTIAGCSLLGNASRWGGGVSAGGAATVNIANSLIAGNVGYDDSPSAPGRAGAVWNSGATVTMTNVTIVGNDATSLSGGVVTEGSSATTTLAGCIVRDNLIAGVAGRQIADSEGGVTTATCSNVEGSWPGVGNIDADALFVDPDGADDDPLTFTDNDYRLGGGSPSIDAGHTPAANAEGLTVDLDGEPRYVDDPSTPDTGIGETGLDMVDMGAYEFGLDCPGDTNGDGQLNIDDIVNAVICFGQHGVPDCAGPGTTGDIDDGSGTGTPDGLNNIDDIVYAVLRFGSACP